jgi:DNA polymerase III delta prime subunit
VVGQDEVIKRLRSYVESGNLPHLLFSGPPGVGKTASAIAIAKDLFGETWSNNFTELNAEKQILKSYSSTKLTPLLQTLKVHCGELWRNIPAPAGLFFHVTIHPRSLSPFNPDVQYIGSAPFLRKPSCNELSSLLKKKVL